MASHGHIGSRPGGTAGFSLIDRRGHGARTSDRVFDQLLEAIRSLRVSPGQPLSEVELARELGVSRTPVREAIVRLTDAGLVNVVPQVGTAVALIDLVAVDEARFVRESLEVAAIRHAMPVTTADVASMRRLVDRQREALDAGDVEEFFELDEDLHGQIFALSGYPGAWSTVQRTKIHLDRMRRLVLPDRELIAEVIAEHSQIVDALEAGDAAAGDARVRAHAGRVIAMVPELKRQFPDYFA